MRVPPEVRRTRPRRRLSLVSLCLLGACSVEEHPLGIPQDQPDLPAPTSGLAISLSKSSLSIDRGWHDSLVVTATRPRGFDAAISVKIDGLPEGLRAGPYPLFIASGTTTVTIYLAAEFRATPGRHTVTVRAGVANDLPASASATIEIGDYVPFRLTVDTESLTVQQNDAASARVRVRNAHDFAYYVDVRADGGPEGMLVEVDQGVGARALNVVAAPSVAPGDYLITVTGTAIGPREKRVTVNVRVVTAAAAVTTAADAAISGGYAHTCGLQVNGSAYCWGRNDYGRLGDGTAIDPQTVPVPVKGGHTFIRVTSGNSHTCGIASDQRAWCWGMNDEGMLGDGTTSTRTEPTAVSGGLEFKDLSAGGKFACALTISGQAFCWGSNWAGQLGIGGSHGDEAYPRLTPVEVSGDLTFAAITAGNDHACALTPEGKAYCWGHNYDGQVGNGTTLPAERPGQRVPAAVAGDLTFSSISAGSYHTCALTASGSVLCWGATYGPLPVLVPGGLRFGSLSAGGNHACGLTTSGSAVCWGWNEHDALGNGTGLGGPVPTAVVSGLVFRDISASKYAHTCAITGEGEAWCWGFNLSGQIGDGTQGNGDIIRSVPARVAGGLKFRTP